MKTLQLACRYDRKLCRARGQRPTSVPRHAVKWRDGPLLHLGRYKAKSFSPGDLRPGFFFHTLSTRSMAFGESLDEFQHVTANGTAADSVVRLRERKVVLVRQQFSCL